MKLKEPLSKRDYIAIKAMQSIIKTENNKFSIVDMVKHSYYFADAMLEESKKG